MTILQPEKPIDVPKDTKYPATPLVVAEYTALREEILKRIEIKQQVNTIVVAAFGATIALGLQYKEATLILLYPILLPLFSVVWSTNERRAREIGSYIRTQIEEKCGEGGWESLRHKVRKTHKQIEYGDILVRGTLLCSGILATIVGCFVAAAHNIQIPFVLFLVLLAADFGSVVATGIVLSYPYLYKQRAKSEDLIGCTLATIPLPKSTSPKTGILGESEERKEKPNARQNTQSQI